MSAKDGAALVVARIGGLPCEVMDAFHTRLEETLAVRGRIEADLAEARGELGDRLHAAVPGAAAGKRRDLLALKRDCFNGRPLAPWLEREGGEGVLEAAGELAHRVVELERALAAATRDLAVHHREEVLRQVHQVAELARDPLFRCGLAAASPLVAAQADRLRRPAESHGRRERRVALTLLRYLSRATLKLSPFSTFTPVGLARIEDGRGALALGGGPWRLESLVRLRRHILDRCVCLLQGYAPWRRRLRVALNDSATTLEDGRTLFQRPSHYRLDDEGRRLRYHEESLVRVHLSGPLVERVRALLAASQPTLEELLAALPDGTEQVDRLIDIGYLLLKAPWSTDDGHLEKSMLRALRELPSSEPLDTFLTHLERLVGLQDGALGDADPGAAFTAVQAEIDRLLTSAAGLAGLGPEVDVTTRPSEHDVYQDVWCEPRAAQPEGGAPALVRLGEEAAKAALRNAEILVRQARLYDHRVDFLHTLGAWLKDRHGDECHQPLVRVFQEVLPLWKDFMRFEVRSRAEAGGWCSTWNPAGLDVLRELARWREEARLGSDACRADGPDGRRIDAGALARVLDAVPERFTAGACGACLFLQPASADGSLWMLNRLKEGTGRFASRYTPLMPERLRRLYTERLRARGELEIDGERAELLDVQCIQGDTLNVHAPQTPKVLTLPGADCALPEGHRLSLGGLFVVLGSDGLPRLRDAAGQRYLPVHLGVGYHDYMPTLVKFLCAFGPSELGAVLPPPLQRRAGAAIVQERTVLGNLVLHRRSWSFPAADLRQRIEGLSDCETFAAVHAWRVEHGVPARVFAQERVPHPVLGFHYQPQYLDLTSPLFVAILRSILDSVGDVLTLAEILPEAEHFPRDPDGRGWAVELLLDSLALRTEVEKTAPLPAWERDVQRARRAPNRGGTCDGEPERYRQSGDRAALG